MSSNEQGDAQAWRHKYYDSVAVLDRTERQLEELESLLYCSVSRLALGVCGLSEALDQELDQLLEAVREKRDPKTISELAFQIQEGSRRREASRPEAQATPPDYGALLDALAAKIGPELPADELRERAGEALDPSTAATVIAEVLAEAFREDTQLVADLEEGLAQLIAALPLSGPLRARAGTLRDQLGTMDVAAAIAAVAEITDALREEVERERAEMRRYLGVLDGRLRGLGELLTEQVAENLAETRLRTLLGDQIGGEVEGMRRAVADAVEVEPLRLAVSQRISAIETGMSDFLAAEAERRTRIERSAERTSERLAQIETESAQLCERLAAVSEAAAHDALTGCYNRAAFDEHMVKEYARWCRHPEPLALLMCDIDWFKNVNDTYGHPVGDKVLRAVAGVLLRGVRVSDFLARYGGEEFVLLLPATALEGARKLAEGLRSRIAKTRFLHQARRVKMTVSFGVAGFSADDTPATVIERADRALYQAKMAGRNRVKTGPAA